MGSKGPSVNSTLATDKTLAPTKRPFLDRNYLDRGSDLQLALDAYENSLEVDNDPMGRSISFNSIGVIHARQGREEEALVAWRAATRERPDYAITWYNLGNLLAKRFDGAARRENRYDLQLLAEARSHLSRAVALDPRYEKALFRLIWCDVQKAVYLIATRKDSEFASATLNEAEQNRLRLLEVDPEGSLTLAAGQMLQSAREALGSRGTTDD